MPNILPRIGICMSIATAAEGIAPSNTKSLITALINFLSLLELKMLFIKYLALAR